MIRGHYVSVPKRSSSRQLGEEVELCDGYERYLKYVHHKGEQNQTETIALRTDHHRALNVDKATANSRDSKGSADNYTYYVRCQSNRTGILLKRTNVLNPM